MEKLVRILMRRDGIEESEARELIQDTLDEMRSALEVGNDILAEDIFEGNLGLEPDYLFDIMDYLM